MTLLILGATSYSEQLYHRQVDEEAIASLNRIVGEIDRRLVYERETFQSLVDAPAMSQYIPVLQSAATGNLHPEFFERTDRLNKFLEAFQAIVPALSTIRVLDAHANTLVKVRFGRATPAAFDGIESFPYAEEELDDEAYLRRIRNLVPNEVGVTLLTQTRLEQGEASSLPMLDYILPLSRDSAVIGYLVANTRGEQIDRILDFASRPHRGTLLIGEVNPEQPLRNGVLLYDDKRGLRFSDIKSVGVRLQDVANGRLWDAAAQNPEGRIGVADGRDTLYYVEYLPYPNLLVHWIVATRITQEAIGAPFQRIRWAIALFAGLLLLLSLWLVRISASRVAKPVSQLAATMSAYASGDHRVRAPSSETKEIAELADAFNAMADTLDAARQERDRAQHMMLQSAKLASIGEMAAGIGHELNNPLNNILSLSKLMERGLPQSDAALRRDINSLREEAVRASSIVSGILNFARQVPPQYTRFAVAALVDDSLALVQQEAKARDVALQAEVDAGLNIDGDRVQLQQVLINLLLNAVQASTRGARVVVSATGTETEVTIAVRDEGCGIKAPDMDKVFDPFFTTKPVGEGSGLGLSISLGIAQRHGGKLTLRPNETQGVTAVLQLPREGQRAAAGGGAAGGAS